MQAVRREQLGEALDELREEPFAKLRWCEADWLVDVPFDQREERQPYLLRALIHAIGTGDFSVDLSGSKVHVAGFSLSHSDLPMRRWAVVALLEQEPEVVYVTCSLAE